MTVVIDGCRIDGVVFDLDTVIGGGIPSPRHDAVPPFSRLATRLREAGILVAAVTAGGASWDALVRAGLAEFFDVVVDGRAVASMRLSGKPEPGLYLEAAARLGVDPARAAVLDGTAEGLTAGQRGGFGLVIGLTGGGSGAGLLAAGAETAVTDLGEVGVEPGRSEWNLDLAEPSSLQNAAEGPAGGLEVRREALATLANGYLGTRGAPPWSSHDGTSYPGCYLAGVYDRAPVVVDGRPAEREALVNVPNWPAVHFSAGGGWVGDSDVRVAHHRVRLDLRKGLLVRFCQVTDADGRCSAVVERRIVSMAEPHLAALELTISPLNWSGALRIRSGIGGQVSNSQTLEEKILRPDHFSATRWGDDPPESCWLAGTTSHSGIVVAMAVRTRLDGEDAGGRSLVPGCGVLQETSSQVPAGGRVTLEKVAAVFTSRDRAISEPAEASRAAIAAAPCFADLVKDHEEAWARLWTRSHIEVTTKPDAGWNAGTGPVRVQAFHLLQVASRHVEDLDVGIPARGLGGEGYLGHVFWDELFVFPFLNFRLPGAARALLRYRGRRLNAARRAASEAGWQGAMYPWQSGSDGRDETPNRLYNPRSRRWIPDRSNRQRHVGLAVAYELWQHWQTTGDSRFFLEEGAEVFLEIARFFASLAEFDRAMSKWRIRGVMGPDEFHDAYPSAEDGGIDDNAYTNVMTAWLLRRASELARGMRNDYRDEVFERIGVSDGEIDLWDELAGRIYVPFHDGVISQFHGYADLAPLDLDNYRHRYGNIGRLDLILEAQGDAVRRYQVAKQADVLMLFYLMSAEELREVLGGLGYPLSAGTIRRTVDYYSRRVAHGSSLSEVVHAWVSARTDRRASWSHFTTSLSTDLADVQGGTTAEGLHLGAMAGTVDLLQRCYAGLEVRDEALWLNPVLPDELNRLRFGITYRDHWVEIDADHHRLVVASMPGRAQPLRVMARGEKMELRCGGQVVVESVG